MPFIENMFIYVPKKLEENYEFIGSDEKNRFGKNISIEEFYVKTKDGCLINVLYFENSDTDDLVIYAHGNSGNILNCINFAEYLCCCSSVLLFDYRGYGKSTGKPNESGLYEDIYSVWNHMINEKNKDPSKITLYGFSLGSCIVANLCSRINESMPKAIILQSGFSSIKDVAATIFPHIIVAIMYHELDTEKYIKKIKSDIPILICHSKSDEMIGIENAKKLVKARNGTELYELKGSHNDTILDNNLLEKLKEYIKK